MPDRIIIVHGFGAVRGVMYPLGYRLSRLGYQVLYWSYPSLFRSIDTHARAFHDYLRSLPNSDQRTHILAHSMGAIVARAAISCASSVNLGNILLLAPPNKGTPVARYASYLVGRILKPTAELSDGAGSYVNSLPMLPLHRVGVIAARFDFLVPLKSTHLLSPYQITVLNHTHTSLLFSRKVVHLADQFFRTGILNEAC